MVRSLFGNSNRKLRSTFWGSPFIPVGMSQTECCLPLTNFSVPSRFQTHATQIPPFMDSNCYGCGISTINGQIAFHYACDTPTGFFCQIVSTQGFYQGCLYILMFRSSYEGLLHPVFLQPWVRISWARLFKMGLSEPGVRPKFDFR